MLSGVFKPAAYIPHKGAPRAASGVGRVTMKDANSDKGDRLVLWDIAHVRLVSDWKPLPAAAAPSANANDSAAYDDNDQFYASKRPPHVVHSQDDEDPDDGDEDEYDGHDCGDIGSSGGGDHWVGAGGEAGGAGGGPGGGGGGVGSGGGGAGSGGGGAGSGGDVDMDYWVGNGESALKVRLDIFHALQRVSKLCKKSHGAFKPFMARLRDACFIVNLDDIKEASAVEQALAGKGMTPEAVVEYKDKNWTFFVRNCRRLVPEQKRLLERFNLVIRQFQDVVDAKSGETLLRPCARQAVELLRKHIESGCLSDPERVPLYYTSGKNSAGITTRRCVRGTNCTEGYHRYVRRLLSTYCASPSLAHSVLLEFNYRWNVRMAVKNRGLPREVGEFFDQFEIEIIQRETASWYPDSPLFPEWVSALDAADTGEQSGLSESLWGPASGGDVPSEPSDLVDEQGLAQNAVPMPKLTHSAKKYAQMMHAGMPVTPVHTGAEKRKYASELNSQLCRGSQRGRIRTTKTSTLMPGP
ncbi:unnamed protein product [Ectocarpus sp. CCAP 1310/34]|nr:unnamed protein product [Ectocarpus sp. CCAP 1310/34]